MTLLASLRLVSPNDCRDVPLTFGVELPPGVFLGESAISAQYQEYSEFACGVRPCLAWPDGSVRWAQVDCLLPRVAAGEHHLTLSTASAEAAASLCRTPQASWRHEPPDAALRLFEDGPVLVLQSQTAGAPFAFSCEAADIFVEHSLAGVTRGRALLDAANGLTADVYVTSRETAGLARVTLVLRNPRRARHTGGLWDLEDDGAIPFDCCQLTLTSETAAQVLQFADRGGPGELRRDWDGQALSTLSIRQLNSNAQPGGCPGEATLDDRQAPLTRCEPTVRSRREGGGLTLAIPEFWQNAPSVLQANGCELGLELFPRESGPHALQGGEQKTRSFWVQLDDGDDRGPQVLDWVHRPPLTLPNGLPTLFSVLAPAAAIDVALPADFQRLLALAQDAEQGLLARREIANEYGWRDFGDIWADHEQLHYTGPGQITSHYNNQFDSILGGVLHWLRTGDRYWHQLFDPLARHVADIDIYHTAEDRPEYNGGLFWHSDHYVDAGTATHRAYSRVNAKPGVPYGGGPSNEHNYTTGLLLHHLLTGNEQTQDAVLSLSHWAVNMDDGSQSALGFLDNGANGVGQLHQGPELSRPWSRRRKFVERCAGWVSANFGAKVLGLRRCAGAARRASGAGHRKPGAARRGEPLVIYRLPHRLDQVPGGQGGSRRE